MKKKTLLNNLVYRFLSIAVVAAACSARAASSDGGLRVEVITAYNLVVDSNAGTPSSYAPRSAYIGATYYNDGAVALSNVVARIGDYKGGVGDTPGIYPTSTNAVLTGPLPGGAFALTHEGGSNSLADATRYIGAIPAGGSVTVYWLVSYPQVDKNNVPTWGTSVKPDDDLKLYFDVWATAQEAGTTRTVDLTRSFTCRNEISASANKIFPNGANKVPDYYKQIMNQYYPAWTNANYDGSVGSIISTDGVWYDFGNVGEGFDNNGDFVPDHNAWMQPVGDPSLFDPSAFRLVRTYAYVIVKLKTGGEIILSGQDKLYFENIPENNGAVGYVRYQYMPLRAGATSLTTPYQEVASGYDNEKFNADYGVSLGEQIVSAEAHVTLDKTVDRAIASPSNTLTYSVSYSNTGTVSVGSSQFGVPLVVQDAIPAGTTYQSGSAAAANTLPSGVSSYQIFYSTDGGNTWTNAQPTPATAVTHLQWWLSDPLAAGAAGAITFKVTVDDPYKQPSPLITNTAGLSFGNTPPFMTDTAETLVIGNNSVGDTVYADTGVGAGGYLGNAIQDGAEPGITNITVWLYSDPNSNGVVDAGERLIATTNTAANGTYLFSQVADGRYVVVVDTADPDLPAGYTVTTAKRIAVDLDSARATVNPVSVLTADFGFAPALVLTKARLGSGFLYEGQQVSYLLTVSNALAGSGTPTAQPAVYTAWPTNGTTGAGTKAWLNATNCWNPREPDGLYATAPYDNSGETITLSSGYFIGTQLGSPTNVVLVIPMVLSGPFPSGNTLQINVRTNGVQIGTRTFDCSTLTSGTLSYDITSYKSAWSWSDFNGSRLSVEMIASKTANPTVDLFVDSVGFRATSSHVVGGTNENTTLNPVPLDDLYDPSRLRYVSAEPAPDSVSTNGGTGTIHWDNLGPIYAGGGRALSVTFTVLQPPGNVSAPLTNTASVTEAYFLNGVPANDDEKKVVDTVLPAGTIGDYVWRDLNGNGLQDDGATGIAGVTVRLLTNGVLLASTVTDSSGYYLFGGLTNSATYTVTVVSSTLPGGSGTPTYDRDGTNTAHTATNIVVNVSATDGTDTNLSADFGYTLQSVIRGTIWHDRDRDGASAPESGEERLGGVAVDLYNGNNVLVASTTTAADGTYVFFGAGVTNGTYYVRVSAGAAPLGSSWTPSFDTDTLATLNEVTVALPLGGERIADYSYYLTGSVAIGDTLFYDWNGDGVQSNGVDTGIADITVWLYQDENTNGVIDAGVDALAGTTVTATNGWYLFPSLPSGAYIVVVDQADTNFPPLYLNTYDPYGAKDGRSAVTVSATNLLQDFGYQPYGFNAIGDTVWYDADANGIQSGATERGLSNVTVRLLMDFDGDGRYTLIQTAVTDADGKYLFSSLPDGSYRAEVDTASAGLPADAFGHRYRLTTPPSYDTSVSGGVQDLDNDFGFAPLGAIGDTVFWDSNVNGDQDWNESGIPGVRMQLYVDNGLTNGVYDEGDTPYGTNVWTDARGHYLFTGLPPANYVVRVDQASTVLAGAILSADPEMDGEPCPNPPVAGTGCDAQTDAIILPGTSFMGADFGYRPTLGVLGDLVWIDLNTNGVRDSGEQGIPYVTVALYGGGSLLSTNVTDADGYYIFDNLTNGTYRVSVLTNDTDFPQGLAASYDADGTADSTANTIVISGNHVATIDGQAVSDADLTIDFGYRYAGNNSLSGTVGLDDPSYDGLMNGTNPSGPGANEYAFANVSVYLNLWNDDGDGVIESGEYRQIASTLTDLSGDYRFTNLPSGDGNDTYIVSLTAPADSLRLTTVNHDGISVYNTTNSQGVTVSAYQVMPVAPARENVDFAFRSTAVRDFGDLPVSYSTTVADQPAGPSHTQTGTGPYLGSAATTTEANGQPSATAAVDGGEDGVAATNRWADGAGGGSVQVRVSGASGWLIGWVDFNQDGTFTNMNERVIEQAVNIGNYTFTFDVPPGTFTTNGATVLNARFRIYPTQPIAPMFTGQATGGEVEDHQFIFGVVGNFVWEDKNGNGLQESGEPGVSNVTVRLYSGGSLLETVATASDGSYAFTGLPTNDYSVVFAKPAGTLFTAQGVGDAQLNSDANVTSGSSGTVTLSPTATRLDVDAGLYVPAILHGYVFKDSNDSLLRDTGDGNITSVWVVLVVNGVNVASNLTDSTGYYRFENIPVGAVSVLVSQASAVLVAVPTNQPAASDERRNRAVDAGPSALITYQVVSGYGVLAELPAETLNFGFKTYPFSTAIDFKVTADGRGGVLIDLWTVNESGYGDIVIYAWIGNAWVEVGRVPSYEVVGEGSNRYTVRSTALPPEGSYYFRIVDESGHVHNSPAPVPVTAIAVSALRFEMQTAVMTFNTEYGCSYQLLVSGALGAGEDGWSAEYVSVLRDGVWSAYSRQPFVAGAGTQTQVRVPVNRQKAFFKIVQLEE